MPYEYLTLRHGRKKARVQGPGKGASGPDLSDYTHTHTHAHSVCPSLQDIILQSFIQLICI